MEINDLDGKGFEKIFELQKQLMNFLVSKNKLNPYPVEINQREGQKVLRDYLGYALEELSEAYTEYENLVIAYNENKPTEIPYILAKLNEELSDSLHFFLELTVFIGIEPEDFYHFYKTLAEEHDITASFIEGDLLESIINISQYENVKQKKMLPRHTYLRWDQQPYNHLISAGRNISMEWGLVYSQELWYITHNFFKTFNLLKSKPWREAGKETDEYQFKEAFMGCMKELLCFYALIGFTPTGLFEAYVAKNKINIQRIKDKY